MAISDQPRIFGQNIANGWRRLKRRVRGSATGSFKLANRAPERLVLVPRNLRTSDAGLAHEFYAGVFTFNGKSVETGGRNPFEMRAPNEAWEKSLHGFRWLRHFESADTSWAGSSARSLVKDWIQDNIRTDNNLRWDIEVASRRLIAWFCHSPLLVEGGEPEFYRLLMRSMAQHIRFLRHRSVDAPDGMQRLSARIALAYASICLSDQRLPLRNAQGNLDAELSEQIQADGSHVSKNAWHSVEILCDLLPLRQAYIKQGSGPSQELISSIDRMFPFVRMMRHSDGSIARFNGSSFSYQDLLAAVLRYDEAQSTTPRDADIAGYRRLSGGDCVVISDCGDASVGEGSTEHHAGCLSFEFSSGENMLVVNCGTPINIDRGSRHVWRTTAAHSTAVLNDTSSCRFHQASSSNNLLQGRIVAGPRKAVCKRSLNEDGEQIVMQHDAYLREFGFRHKRLLSLKSDGTMLMGSDQFTDSSGGQEKYSTRDKVDIRFHLHPTVSLYQTEQPDCLLLDCRDGERWKFICVDAEPIVEESVFFSSPVGTESTVQIVLRASASETHEVRWVFEKLSA